VPPKRLKKSPTPTRPSPLKASATVELWLQNWAELWGTPALPSHLTIEIGRRLRTSLGRCYPSSGKVQLHPALFEEDNSELFREVVCHEAAHAAAQLLHGESIRPHGVEWKRLMVSAGYPPRARMDPSRLSSSMQAAIRPKMKYRYTCKSCGVQRETQRRNRRWRCRLCFDGRKGGELTFELIE